VLRLYEAAIPLRERKDFGTIRAMADSPVHRLRVAMVGAELVGFYALYAGEKLALLEYLATREKVRGRGIGAALYSAARSEAGSRPMVIEVDSDRIDCPDRDLRHRRVEFYRRLGSRRIVGLDFILPLPGIGDPPPLELLVDCAWTQEIAEPLVTGWLSEIYTSVYGCACDDSRLLNMLGTLPERIRLA
jgi:GNAT superfamily N-acetyltransferase